jgi:hypothetical protein
VCVHARMRVWTCVARLHTVSTTYILPLKYTNIQVPQLADGLTHEPQKVGNKRA